LDRLLDIFETESRIMRSFLFPFKKLSISIGLCNMFFQIDNSIGIISYLTAILRLMASSCTNVALRLEQFIVLAIGQQLVFDKTEVLLTSNIINT